MKNKAVLEQRSLFQSSEEPERSASEGRKPEPLGLFDGIDGSESKKEVLTGPYEDKVLPAGASCEIYPREPGPENGWEGIWDLGELRERVIQCTRCGLRKGARGVVFGEGNPHARVMFVGEGPGATEDETGRPFVGRAGQLLDLMLKSSGFDRKDVFIANIVKCRPPDNRLPLPPEVEACLPHLMAQIRIIKPRIIVLLGALSSQTLVDPSLRVTRDRGKWFHKNGIDYLVTYHPAAVLRDEAHKKRPMWEDFQSLRKRLDELLRSKDVE